MEHHNLDAHAPLHLRFLVIGGGLAGIGAAIALAKQGHTITLLEGQDSFSEVRTENSYPPQI